MNYIHKDIATKEGIKILNFLPEIGIKNAKTEILNGLRAQPKKISPKFFYDKKGSELFEKITHLDEYYPTRCEKEILSNFVNKLDIDFSGLNIIELGSGDASKISLFFQQLSPEILRTIHYSPLDISKSAIENSSEEITKRFNLKSITGIIADFHHQLISIPHNEQRLYCFFGSTIGNFSLMEAKAFFTLLSNSMESGDSLLLGVDLVKNTSIIEQAYNDSQGVTEAFNKNILSVLNQLIGSDFVASDFEHIAFYNTEKNRIEMHLKALKDVEIQVQGLDEKIRFTKGETVHTENSHKFDSDSLNKMAGWANFNIEQMFYDSKKWFSMVHFTKK